MTRRMLWTISAGVIGLLMLASLAPRLADRFHVDTVGDATVTALAEQMPLLLRTPVTVVSALAGLGLVTLGWWWSRRVRRRRATAPDASAAFVSVLEEALERPRNRPAPSPRQQMVIELAQSGQGVAEIARATRLSQDAVRSLIASSADSDRHELPPRPDSGGDRD